MLPPILYRDERLIVLNKPSGLLTVPGIGPEKQDCLATRVQRKFPSARIIHRLDRDTSGVIVMAFDAAAHREISRQFHDREVHKTYEAIVDGLVQEDSGTVDLPIRKDMNPANKPRQVIDLKQGRWAVTHWRVLQRHDPEAAATAASNQEQLQHIKCSGRARTRIELNPVTGRSHQLRLHMQQIGHPILGDDLYAPPDALAAADRLLLHATSLWLAHPGTAEPMTFCAPALF